METINDFFEWAWARHHNLLSWYVRPLFLLPFCYFAYRRSGWGIGLTIAGLLTSMFWFPAPEKPTQEAIKFLQMEREYLAGPWTIGKWLMALLVPLTFTLLGIAFWRRNGWYGIGVINVMLISKIIWSQVQNPENAWAHHIPAVLGLTIVNVILIWAIRTFGQQSTS